MFSSMSDSVTRLNAALEGRYAIERELGEGRMATVYLFDDPKPNAKSRSGSRFTEARLPFVAHFEPLSTPRQGANWE